MTRKNKHRSDALAFIFLVTCLPFPQHGWAAAAAVGGECGDALAGLSVNASNSQQALLDVWVVGNMSNYPVWIEEKCHVALRWFYCMEVYAPYMTISGQEWCKDTCYSLLQPCKEFVDTFESESFQTYEKLMCGDKNSSSCQENIIVTADSTLDSPTCPPNLAIRLYGSRHFVYAIDGTGCAVPCPQVMWTTTEWKRLQTGFLCLAFAALICALFTFIGSVVSNKHHMIQKFSGGFVASSLALAVFLAIERQDDLVCDGKERYIRRGLGCVFQASVSLFAFLFVQCCALCQSIHLYMLVVNRESVAYIQSVQRHYSKFCFVTPSFFTLIALATESLGFDENASIPFCFFLLSDNAIFLWTLFVVPMCGMFAPSSYLLVRVALVLARVTRSMSLPDVSNPLTGILSRYNRHAITFIIVFCLSTLYVAIAVVYIFGVKWDAYYNSSKDWVECSLLVGVTSTTSDVLFLKCGHHPHSRPPKWLFVPIVLVMGAYGIIPLIIHGPAGLIEYARSSIGESFSFDRKPRAIEDSGSPLSQRFLNPGATGMTDYSGDSGNTILGNKHLKFWDSSSSGSAIPAANETLR